MTTDILGFAPTTRQIIDIVTERWPRHRKFLQTSFDARSRDLLETSERVAKFIMAVAEGRIAEYCEDYRWTCERLLEL